MHAAPTACETRELPDAGGVLRFWQSWLPLSEAAPLLAELSTGLPWQQKTIRMFGKDVLEPRLTLWMGDTNARYRYSGREHLPLPWHPALESLRRRLVRELGVPLNSVLANLYRDQRDSMGWHADNEKELGDAPCIASLSLGQTRRFLLRHAVHGRVDYALGAGSLLVMSGKMQKEWRHSVPKESGPRSTRINLSFRQIEQGSAR